MKGTVLLVEDDHDVRETIAEILQDEGYAVVTAPEGGQALETLRRGMRPSVIVLDLMMAGMDGFQFRAEQRRDPELAAIPVIVLSADRLLEQKVDELAVAAWLKKPTKLSDLLGVISRVIAGFDRPRE